MVDLGVGQPRLGRPLVIELHELGHDRVVGERRMLLEDGHGHRVLRVRRLRHRRRRREEHELALGRVVELLERLGQQDQVHPDAADPQEVGIGLLHPSGDCAEVAVAELVLEIEHDSEPALLHDLLGPDRDEVHRGELARHDGDRLRWPPGGDERVEDRAGHGRLRLRAHRLGREVHVVRLTSRIDEHGAREEELAVFLGHRHGREVSGGRVRADDEIHLVHRDQPLVERARDLGLGLVIEQDIFDRSSEQPVALVELLEVDLGGDLVDDRGRAERPRQGERSADPDRRPRRRAGRRPGEQGEAQRAAGAQNGQASKKTFHRAASVSGMTSRAKRRMYRRLGQPAPARHDGRAGDPDLTSPEVENLRC